MHVSMNSVRLVKRMRPGCCHEGVESGDPTWFQVVFRRISAPQVGSEAVPNHVQVASNLV